MDENELAQRIEWLEASVRRIAGSVMPPVTLPPHPLQDPGQVSDEVRTLAAAGQTMQAVQLHRQESGAGLAEAKATVDSLAEG